MSRVLGTGLLMWRVLGTGLFLIPVAVHCWVMKKTWPSYKGSSAVLSTIRLALAMGCGIAVLWGVMTTIGLIAIMLLFALSFLVPAIRPKLKG